MKFFVRLLLAQKSNLNLRRNSAIIFSSKKLRTKIVSLGFAFFVARIASSFLTRAEKHSRFFKIAIYYRRSWFCYEKTF